ncbi:hypothetical protein [Henriciella litoralis]|uniref:hypothetical protein n=1 Tax=Henriciella litoralis TaxID=568102 RepID=UPI00111C6034|nr:hypothetical protein [Henriciella litoralis]
MTHKSATLLRRAGIALGLVTAGLFATGCTTYGYYDDYGYADDGYYGSSGGYYDETYYGEGYQPNGFYGGGYYGDGYYYSNGTVVYSQNVYYPTRVAYQNRLNRSYRHYDAVPYHLRDQRPRHHGTNDNRDWRDRGGDHHDRDQRDRYHRTRDQQRDHHRDNDDRGRDWHGNNQGGDRGRDGNRGHDGDKGRGGSWGRGGDSDRDGNRGRGSYGQTPPVSTPATVGGNRGGTPSTNPRRDHLLGGARQENNLGRATLPTQQSRPQPQPQPTIRPQTPRSEAPRPAQPLARSNEDRQRSGMRSGIRDQRDR